jgi:hypothetical protein
MGILPLLLAPVAILAPGPAFAQLWPNDVKASQFVDATYRIDANWLLNFYGEVREDHNISRMDNSIFRPNVQYQFAPHWRVGVGYVQFQSWQSPYHADYGLFEDLYYQNKFGTLNFLGRLRLNETFFDTNPAMWMVGAFLASFSHPIFSSPWSLSISNEVYVSLKTDYTGRKPGFLENKSFFGLGHPIGSHMILTGGYELDQLNATTPLIAHVLKFGAIVSF